MNAADRVTGQSNVKSVIGYQECQWMSRVSVDAKSVSGCQECQWMSRVSVDIKSVSGITHILQ